MFRYLKPYIPQTVLIILFTFVNSISNLAMPALLSRIIDDGVQLENTSAIWNSGILMLLISLLSIVSTVVVSYYSARVSSGLGRDLRSEVFQKTENFSLNEFDHFSTASLITRTTNDIGHVQFFLMMFMRVVLTAPIMCIGSLVMAFATGGQLSLIMLIVMPILAVIIVLTAKFAIPLSKSIQKKIDRVNLVVREKLTGVRVIRAFNTTEHERRRFDKANIDLTQSSIKMNRVMSALMPGLTIVLNATTLIVLWLGTQHIDAGFLETGDLVALVQYVMQLMMSMVMMSMVFVMMPRASASAERISQVCEMKPSIVDQTSVPVASDRYGYLEFDDVSFAYPGADEPTISHLSFIAKPGETTAIIGSTGSGKSTIVKLIPRFYDVSEGSIRVDGVDIREYPQLQLRDKIGYVPQKAVLFTGTIADNLRYGKEDATIEEMEHACKVAQALDFINAKPDRFDSEIAQGGTNVSGGQKQRLCIARAIIRHPEIYIFDDSFSALDFKTDAALRKALKQETKDATVIIVAQRISSVMDAEQIIVLDDGNVSGIGTHAELMASNAVYREIALSQLTEEELA